MSERRVVIDASVAIKWLVNEEGTEAADGLLDRWREEGTCITAPCLLFIEVTNALYKRVRREELTVSEALALLACLEDLHINVKEAIPFSRQALETAARFGCSATYDAYYISLAEVLGCELWTADERLYNSVKDRLDRVRWLGAVNLPQKAISPAENPRKPPECGR